MFQIAKVSQGGWNNKATADSLIKIELQLKNQLNNPPNSNIT